MAIMGYPAIPGGSSFIFVIDFIDMPFSSLCSLATRSFLVVLHPPVAEVTGWNKLFSLSFFSLLRVGFYKPFSIKVS